VAAAISVAAHLALLLLARGRAPAPAQRPIELEVIHLPAARVAVPPPAPHGSDAAVGAARDAAVAAGEAVHDATRTEAARGAPSGAEEPIAAGRDPGHAVATEPVPHPAAAQPFSAPAAGTTAALDAAPQATAAPTPPPTAGAPGPKPPPAFAAADPTHPAPAQDAPASAATEPGTALPAAPPPAPAPRPLRLLPDRYDLAASALPHGAAEGAGTAAAPAAPADPGHRLDALLADGRAVERGTTRVDGYWSEVRRHLERRWEVDAELLRDGPRRGLGLGKLDEAWEGWRKQAAAYAATGNPYGDGYLAPGSPHLADHARPVEPKEVRPLYEDAAEDGAFRKHRTALVLVVQDEGGRVIDVRLHRSSGHKGYDELALSHARALAQLDLGIPPDGAKSLWSFDATLITTPPLPIAGCAVDAYFVPQHCYYPLRQRVKESVHLVGVWRADETPGVR